MTLDEADLEPGTRIVAQAVLALDPELVITSGRRKVEDQARAMSQNVARNRRWIAQTYITTTGSRELQAWVDAHPLVVKPQAIEAALAEIMHDWSDAQKAALSKHFSGQAFDLNPLPAGPHADQVAGRIHVTPGVVKFLTMEGGLRRWHVQTA
jgi:hypothetical protein